jgi:predicted ArsR family transcriptional regulator
MEPLMEITENEILDALRAMDAARTGDEGFTARDAAKVLGVGKRQAQYRLRDLIDCGTVKAVMLVRQDPWGRTSRVPGYQFVTSVKPKRR